jgi:LysR family transcriptional regulator (chromosome initiation inhibitor)
VDLHLDQLRTFSTVVAEGTFEAAAAELRITPSAVSQRVKGLEVSVGRVLLQRSKPVRATESGEIVLRLARQLVLLEDDALAALGTASDDRRALTLPIVVNADSLNTWVMPVLARVAAAENLCFEIIREDQEYSTGLLRSGAAMAAITSVSEPVQGCLVRRLGRMRYRAMASPALVARRFPDGASVDALAVAPVVCFDRLDRLQERYLQRRTRRPINPPRHYVPASADYVEAIRLGMGWGMLPPAQSESLERTGELVELDGGTTVDVVLYWQQWKLRSPRLDALAEAVTSAASAQLG